MSKAKNPAQGSEAELVMCAHLKELGIIYRREERFTELRRWRLDFYLPEYRIGIEIDGGVWTNGRHSRGKGFEADCIKANHATMQGIRLLRFSATQIKRGIGKAFLQEHLK